MRILKSILHEMIRYRRLPVLSDEVWLGIDMLLALAFVCHS